MSKIGDLSLNFVLLLRLRNLFWKMNDDLEK